MTTLPAPEIAPDVDAMLVLGMASTALPFARSPEDEAERWLRILRMYGDAGAALQALGVSEAPLEEGGEAEDGEGARADALEAVTKQSARIAAHRGAQQIAARDVLVAVIDVYGEDFERVLRVHGTDRAEVLGRLELDAVGS